MINQRLEDEKMRYSLFSGGVYLHRYSKVGDSYYYHFKPGVRYQIIENLVIQNLEDGTKHSVRTDIWKKLINQDEWRDLGINKLIENI